MVDPNVCDHFAWPLGRRGFGGANDIIGKQILVNSPNNYRYRGDAYRFCISSGKQNNQVDVLLPFQFNPVSSGSRGSRFLCLW